MNTLSQSQIDQFWHEGYLLVEDAVEPDLLKALQDDFTRWVEQSCAHTEPYGSILDGRPRFDLEPGHTAREPKLRRVNAPVEESQTYFDAMSNSRMTDCVADLIGPNIKFHHSKINAKLPGGATAVKWHQDFAFTPHSNDDLVTALLMVDEVTAENGPLEILAGSHKGELHSLWHEGLFTGAINEKVAAECQKQAQSCTGSAGSVCLMHTRLLHGSAPNLSARPRNLFICVYSAEDAVPLSSSPVPAKHEGMVVRGEYTGQVRSTQFNLALPQKPKTASFFDQQAKM